MSYMPGRFRQSLERAGVRDQNPSAKAGLIAPSEPGAGAPCISVLTCRLLYISSHPDTSICDFGRPVTSIYNHMSRTYIFSSESVGEGHPDKVCDTISDAVLDACLAEDPRSRVACETYAKSNIVVVGGEITTRATPNISAVVRETIRGIGYTHDDDVFHADKVFITNLITAQSLDIAQGVDARAAEGKATANRPGDLDDVRLRVR